MSARVLLADDHPVTREGIKDLLARNGHFVVAECSDGEEAVIAAEKVRPAVALLDLSMPRMNGVDAAQKIADLSPFTKVIIMSVHNEEPYVWATLRAGVSGYVVKTEEGSTILRAIDEALRGRAFLSPSASRAVVSACQTEGNPAGHWLTPGDEDLLKLIAEGCTTREIARRMGVTFKTAEYHRIGLMKKLDLTKTANLVRYAVRTGLVRVERAPCGRGSIGANGGDAASAPKEMRAGYETI